MSNSETNEKKRSRQETASQENVATESLRALRPAAADNSYPLLAPRATYTQEQFNTGVQHAYLGDSGVPRTAGTRKLKQIPEDDISEEVYARMSRSERKRYREKKRRSEVNKGFDDLTALLLKVDPQVSADSDADEKSSGGRSASMKEGENPVLNRVDLITRTIKALDRMSRENDEFKALLAERSQDGSEIAAARQAIKDDRVLLMVPFLTPSGPVVARATERAASAAEQHSHDTQTNTQEAASTSLAARSSAENTTFRSQQHSLRRPQIPIQKAVALGPSAPYQAMPFVPMRYNVPPQPGESIPFRNTVRNDLQGYSDQPAFYRGYFQSVYDPGLNPDQQNVMNQRGRMI
jgi:hypothetical protein